MNDHNTTAFYNEGKSDDSTNARTALPVTTTALPFSSLDNGQRPYHYLSYPDINIRLSSNNQQFY
jgi:hypothetical protein